jgi:PAS domain S-box-containing protein
VASTGDFANRVRAYRECEGISQEELAKRLGMSRNYVSMIEGGRDPSDQVVRHFELLQLAPAVMPADNFHKTQESPPTYELIKKVINIRESGSPEQNSLLDAFLETLTRQLPALAHAMVTTDAEGRVTEINPAFTEMCGYAIADLRGKKPGDVLQGPETEQDVVEEFRAAIRERRPFECTITNYASDKTTYRVHIEMFPIFDGAGRLTQFKAIENKL